MSGTQTQERTTPQSMLGVDHLERRLSRAGMTRALRALALARTHHTGRRRNGAPEISHPVAVADGVLRVLATHLPPDPDFVEDAVITALLHDVREDHDVSDAELRAVFGARPADAVARLTKTLETTARHPGGAFAAAADCPVAAIVKACDRRDNLATMDGAFRPEKQLSYGRETREEILPMLDRACRQFPDLHGFFGRAIVSIDAALDAAGV